MDSIAKSLVCLDAHYSERQGLMGFNLIGLAQKWAILIARLAWKWALQLHCGTANPKCPVLNASTFLL